MSFTMPNTIANSASRDARPVQANFAAVTAALQNDFIRKDGTIAMTGPLTLAADPAAPTQAATKQYVDNTLPPGTIVDYVGDSAPNVFWAVAIGQLVNKADNPILWGICQNKFGTSTATQFYLPNLQSRFVVGKGTATWSDVIGETGGSKDAVAVAHTHTIAHGHGNNFAISSSGAHTHTQTGYNNLANSGYLFRGGDGANGWETLNGSGTITKSYTTPDVASTGSAHTHTITGGVTNLGTGTTTAGQLPTSTATNTNLPPYIVLNKIIRLG
jgi:microcystin-dependent protein